MKVAPALGCTEPSAVALCAAAAASLLHGEEYDAIDLSMKNVDQLSTEGMIEADHTILDIMLKKHLTVEG